MEYRLKTEALTHINHKIPMNDYLTDYHIYPNQINPMKTQVVKLPKISSKSYNEKKQQTENLTFSSHAKL